MSAFNINGSISYQAMDKDRKKIGNPCASAAEAHKKAVLSGLGVTAFERAKWGELQKKYAKKSGHLSIVRSETYHVTDGKGRAVGDPCASRAQAKALIRDKMPKKKDKPPERSAPGVGQGDG